MMELSTFIAISCFAIFILYLISVNFISYGKASDGEGKKPEIKYKIMPETQHSISIDKSIELINQQQLNK